MPLRNGFTATFYDRQIQDLFLNVRSKDEPRDMMIASKNGWVLALDNLSGIQAWQSDCLCRLSTGGGFSTRTLYENDEETIFDAQRPIIINGIDEVATRADLLDRCLLINLPRIDQVQRKSESELWLAFHEARPRILGALLTAVSVALRRLSTTKLASLPRMADFALWATAAEPGLGLAQGEFMAAYMANRDAGNELALEASPVGKAIVDLMDRVSEWAGTATELLAELNSAADEPTKRLKSWPQSARSLGSSMRRLAPNLRQAGIDTDFGGVGRGRSKHRCISLIRTLPESCVPNVPNDPDPQNADSCGDDRDNAFGRGDANHWQSNQAGTQVALDASPCPITSGTFGNVGDEQMQVQSGHAEQDRPSEDFYASLPSSEDQIELWHHEWQNSVAAAQVN